MTATLPPRAHKWDRDDERRIPHSEAVDGNGRTERRCVRCGMVKITVHPPQGLPWREWRTAAGERWQGHLTPPCLAGSAS